MSVQVRRRREAAAFLSSFVGAQGELIVETTANRVQVHDGATPGGWPAARIADLPGRNAVINGNFFINQRGYVSGAALAAGAYAHDRWKAGSGGGTYTFTQTVPDTVVTITAGTVVQAVEAVNVYATSYWLSWTGTAQARVWQGTAAGAYASSPILVTGLAVGTVTSLEFSTGTVGLVQFESSLPASTGPTRFERRSSTLELSLCQRYFCWGPYILGSWSETSTSQFLASFPYPVPMRAVPSIALNGSQSVNRYGVGVSLISSLSSNTAVSSSSAVLVFITDTQAVKVPGWLAPNAVSLTAEI